MKQMFAALIVLAPFVVGTMALAHDTPRTRRIAHAPVPVAAANDNRRPAGVMHGDTLVLDLDVRMARWYPEASDGEFIEAPVLGEVGKAPQVPGPLIRAREGTFIIARLTNALADSSITWLGMNTHPGMDSVRLRPGESRTLRFMAGQPGTYLHAVRVGAIDWKKREREQAAAAFIIDTRGARTDDRVFVLNIWSEPIDSINGRQALTINGKGWPYTERIEAAFGDTVRWRIVNASNRDHPMHLHGFYYRILSRGNGLIDSLFAPRTQENVVTQTMPPFSTMGLQWVASREGHWLFHCHLSFHVSTGARYGAGVTHEDDMSGDMTRHMAGLVLGLDVKPSSFSRKLAREHPRAMRLVVQEGKRRGRAVRTLGFVLQNGASPAADSVTIPGPPLVLTRGQPTDITVVNHLHEPTAVHWHGIELESYSDGVAGWSGSATRMAPFIAPSDSFTAHLTLPRAGTFIYHTHLNDVEQLTSGMYGAILVLEPGRHFTPTTDHLFIVGWDGPEDPPHLLVNGDSTPAPLVIAAGAHHRMRFIFIGAVGGETFTLRRGTEVVTWKSLARDGFEIAQRNQRVMPASVTGWAGQTFDFDFLPALRGEYTLVAGNPSTPMWKGALVVR